MRVILQRVCYAQVEVMGKVVGSIQSGLLVLLGITEADDESDIRWLCGKIISIRIFNDENGKMNHSLQDVGGSLLVVSQFTLYASTKKGNRPSFIEAAKPEKAIPLYHKFITILRQESTLCVETGEFGEDMKVSLCNDGPVTIVIDSKNKE